MTRGEAYSKGIRKNQLTGSYGDFNPVLVDSDGDRYPVDVIYFKTAESEGKVVHPTQKPVELARYLIRTYSNKGDVILDNTCGFRVIIVIEANSYVNIRSSRLLPKFKTQKINGIVKFFV